MVELKNKIVTLCNESGLSIEAVLFILKDLYRDAEESYIAYKEKRKASEKNNKTEQEPLDTEE